MQNTLLFIAGFFVLVKVACTIWYARQPDATKVTRTMQGRLLYYAGKFSPAFFMASLLIRACLPGNSFRLLPIEGYMTRIAFWSIMLLITVVAAIMAVRQRASGQSYGLIHDRKRARK